MERICTDLAAEQAALDILVDGLDDQTWLRPTPAEGWSIADSISHLWFFDRRAVLALSDPDEFAVDTESLRSEALRSRGSLTAQSIIPGRSMSRTELIGRWRDDRGTLLEQLSASDPSRRIPWYGPAMGARSFATARLMEVWAHGQDIADALGQHRVATDRLRHVAHLGITARPFSYANRGLDVPATAPYVDLTGPSGDRWTWSQAGPDSVTGDAEEFCLVVTQRRNIADTELHVTGEAQRWMAIAQAFAGEPGTGRPATHVRLASARPASEISPNDR